jgi:hypothetical protein
LTGVPRDDTPPSHCAIGWHINVTPLSVRWAAGLVGGYFATIKNSGIKTTSTLSDAAEKETI